MAKIVVEFDTVEKTMVVTQNGQVVEDVDTVEFWKSFESDDKFRVGLTTVKIDENEKTQTMTRVFANDCPEGREEQVDENGDPLTPLQAAVASYLERD